MKRLLTLSILLISFVFANAGDGDQHITVNVGILAPYTLDATIGYEHPLNTHSSIEVYGEVGNHWRTPVCHNFWKGWFWDGGAIYKHRLAKFKNGSFKALGGLQTGLVVKKYFFGIELGFEYEYVFRNNWALSIRQKNTVNFLHGDTFRTGGLIGIKIPF